MRGISSPNPSTSHQAKCIGFGQELCLPPCLGSTYLFIPLTQKSLQEQHQLGEGGPSLKLFFPAFLHDLITEGEREKGSESPAVEVGLEVQEEILRRSSLVPC